MIWSMQRSIDEGTKYNSAWNSLNDQWKEGYAVFSL